MAKRKPKPADPAEQQPAPSEREAEAIAADLQRTQTRVPPVATSYKVRVKPDGTRSVTLGPFHSDHVGWHLRFMANFGTASIHFAGAEFARIVEALRCHDRTATETEVNGALAMIGSIEPGNEIEAALAVQMAATHALAMDFLGRARRADTVERADSATNRASKLLRTFTAQTEALAKMRRGGQQTVRVEHVHVHSGGQAIVANVSHGGKPGGGGEAKTDVQSHTNGSSTPALAHALEPTMWSPDALGEVVPVASGEREETLPDAWRNEPRRSQG